MIIEICIKGSVYDGGQQELKRVLDPCSVVWDDVFNLHCLFIKSPILFQNRGWILQSIPAQLLSLCSSSFVAITGVLAFTVCGLVCNPRVQGRKREHKATPYTPELLFFNVGLCFLYLMYVILCFSPLWAASLQPTDPC